MPCAQHRTFCASCVEGFPVRIVPFTGLVYHTPRMMRSVITKVRPLRRGVGLARLASWPCTALLGARQEKKRGKGVSFFASISSACLVCDGRLRPRERCRDGEATDL